MNSDITYSLNLILDNITNMISSFLPDDFYIKLILATAALVIVFGFVNIFYSNKEVESTEENTI